MHLREAGVPGSRALVVTDETVGPLHLGTLTDALRASFGDPDSVRFVSGGPDRDGYRHRSWVYPFGSFSVFADSSATLNWFEVAVAGASVVTSEGEFDAGTRLDELARTYPRSWECRAVQLGHQRYMANDPPQESLAVYDVSALDAHMKERQPPPASVRFVGRDGRLASIEVGG